MTDAQLAKTKVNEVIWDETTRGLHLRHLPSGKKVFLVYYRTKAGQQRRPKIGEYPTLSIKSARLAAQKIMAQVALGEDPKEKWDEKKAEIAAEMRVDDLFQKIWTDLWSADRFVESRWAREVQYNYKNHIQPIFGTQRLSDLTPPIIRQWHVAYRKTSIYAGNRSLEILSRMFSFAEEQGLRKQGTNPCVLVKSHTETKRSRYATEEETKKIGAILARHKDKYPAEVAFIFTLMFSGSRPRAIERAERNDLKHVEFEGKLYGVLTFHGKSTHKTGENETIVIPGAILKMIEAIPAPTDGTLLGIKMPKSFWDSVKKEAGCEDLWVRDWRRTFASTAISSGVSLSIIGETLNHKSAQTTKIYGKLMQDTRLQTVNTVEKKYKKLMG